MCLPWSQAIAQPWQEKAAALIALARAYLEQAPRCSFGGDLLGMSLGVPRAFRDTGVSPFFEDASVFFVFGFKRKPQG